MRGCRRTAALPVARRRRQRSAHRPPLLARRLRAARSAAVPSGADRPSDPLLVGDVPDSVAHIHLLDGLTRPRFVRCRHCRCWRCRPLAVRLCCRCSLPPAPRRRRRRSRSNSESSSSRRTTLRSSMTPPTSTLSMRSATEAKEKGGRAVKCAASRPLPLSAAAVRPVVHCTALHPHAHIRDLTVHSVRRASASPPPP